MYIFLTCTVHMLVRIPGGYGAGPGVDGTDK